MTTPTPDGPYTQPRASTQATRTLIAGDRPPPSPAQQDSNHYERAAATAASAGTMPSSTARGAAAVVAQDGGAGRRQSWTMSGLRGQRQGEVVERKAGGLGYESLGGEGK